MCGRGSAGSLYAPQSRRKTLTHFLSENLDTSNQVYVQIYQTFQHLDCDLFVYLRPVSVLAFVHKADEKDLSCLYRQSFSAIKEQITSYIYIYSKKIKTESLMNLKIS